MRGAAAPAVWGRWRAGHRWRLLRQIGDELVSGLEQFLLVNNVVAVENGAALVSGQEHGNPLGDAGADQVAGGGAATVVEEAGRHPVSVFYSSLRLITVNTITSFVFIGLQRIDYQPVPPPFMLITGPPGV